MTTITYYTKGTPYEEDAKHLQLTALGYPFKAYEREPQKDWVTACSMKAEVCLTALTELNDDILWLDADAWVKKWPYLFNKPNFEVACYVEPWKEMTGKKCKLYKEFARLNNGMWTTGILYLKNTPRVLEMVRNWQEICVANPREWDQVSLQRAWIAMDDKPTFRQLSRDHSCYGSFFGHSSGLRRHWGGRVSSVSAAPQPSTSG